MLEQALIVIGSFLAAVVLTPIVRNIAIRFNIVDHPDGKRKLHGRIVARAGGTAVLLTVLFICSLALIRYDFSALNSSHYRPFVALLITMVGVWLLGLADDVWNLRGRQKLLGQIVLAGFLVVSGFQIQHVQVAGIQLDLGLLAIPMSIIWLLATTNALNLIDGADGLCSTLGAIIAGSLGVLAFVNGHFAETAIAFALCGALLGFLVFNFPPASIFLGDSGSLLIGMVNSLFTQRTSFSSLFGAISHLVDSPIGFGDGHHTPQVDWTKYLYDRSRASSSFATEPWFGRSWAIDGCDDHGAHHCGWGACRTGTRP
ncbi:MAG: undecaprenyl/decaprenyl-phosphate alpha-N-acetylglucosaminyl 1-phosphate transferase [Planctomycetales bacterium]|nr:undecaprenyl/decaprenyl-phosphate alpha-N-acetylglucosaminyl 1-phosphate transferase [Planctomycetales bacterium]